MNKSEVNIVFSLLVHEEPETVIEQLFNILFFNENCIVVVHINENFIKGTSRMSFDEMMRIIKKMDRVFINPNTVKTFWGNIIQAHISNFNYIKDKNFTYFCFLSSNEMFLRPGAYDAIKGYDIGNNSKSCTNWHYFKDARNDVCLNMMATKAGANEDDIVYSQIEGSFYKKSIISSIFEIIEKEYDFEKENPVYPREETYIPTLARAMYKDASNYSKCLCKVKWQGKILFVSVKTVRMVSEGRLDYFSVKRVDRQPNNYLRSYIRHWLLKMDEKNTYLEGYSFKESSLLKIYFLNTYYSFVYSLRNISANLYRRVFRKK